MLERIRKQLHKQQLDALLVSSKSNVFYLTGFRGSNGYILVTKNHQYLLTDARYTEKAKKVVPESYRIVDIGEGLFFLLHTLLVKHRVKSIGFEAYDLSYAFYTQLDSLNGFKLHPADDLLKQIRSLKRKEELTCIRKSQKMNELALKLLLDELKVGVTEVDLAWKLQLIAKDLGATKLAFDPIIAFGGNSSIPHHEVSSKKKLKRGDIILIDMGVVVDNYASDMTRTFFTKNPTKQQRHVYDTVLEANERAIAGIKPGASCDTIDKLARRHTSHSGYSKKFTHATGHGIGLDVHEYPRVAKGSKDTLKSGMVVTVEPGIYLPGKLGIRIEDMVEVTDKGKKVLTRYEKQIGNMIKKI